MITRNQHEGDQLPLIEEMGGDDSGLPVTGPMEPPGAKTLGDRRRPRKTIQDLLLPEGLLAVRLSMGTDNAGELQQKLQQELKQNSAETRRRYAQSILLWFFWDGVDGLARKAWQAYEDEDLEIGILRYLYLTAEPLLGTCVEQCLFPLEEGMLIPPSYFERYLRDTLGEDPPAKTLERLKMNLAKLGFMDRSPTKGDRLKRVAENKTAFLLVFHSVFSPAGPRTVELHQIIRHPFWKYLGLKSEKSVRGILKEADGSGLLGKYVVADELEQVTTCFSLSEILDRRIRL